MSYYLNLEKLIGRDNLIKNLWDDREKLKHIQGFHAWLPLRITLKEWEDHFTASDVERSIYAYGRFTLVFYREWAGNWDYCDVYEVVCPLATPQRVVFGPHKTDGLAKKKALDYLVKHGAIEIIEFLGANGENQEDQHLRCAAALAPLAYSSRCDH
jgi:hypothetical protein